MKGIRRFRGGRNAKAGLEGRITRIERLSRWIKRSNYIETKISDTKYEISELRREFMSEISGLKRDVRSLFRLTMAYPRHMSLVKNINMI